MENEIMEEETLIFQGFKCCIRKEVYAHCSVWPPYERASLTLEDPDTGEDIAVATVNLPEEFLNPGETIIKTYSENEGILEVLISAHIISVPLRRTDHPLRLPICNILI
jgi:hypothetical protein